MFKMNLLLEMYSIVRDFDEKSESDKKKLRTCFRDCIQQYMEVEIDTGLTLAETIVTVGRIDNKDKIRKMAMVILYSLSTKILNADDKDGKLIALFDGGILDFYKKYNIDIKDQAYKKVDKLSGIHKALCDVLGSIINIDSTIESILSMRQGIEKSVNDKTLNAYLNHLGFSHIKDSIKKNISRLSYFDMDEERFYEQIPELLEDIEFELNYCHENPTFVTLDYYSIYLGKLKSALIREKEKSKDKFKCDIIRADNKAKMDRKYPLHIENHEVYIPILLTVSGKGTAKNVRGEMSADGNLIKITEACFSFGDIKPGDFVIPMRFAVIKQISKVVISLLIEWDQVGSNDEYNNIFDIEILGQDSDIDWSCLENLDPYSLEVVRGNAFIGRKDTIRRIWNRLLSPTMSSSYITGHKRVGKSSLAYAVIEHGRNSNLNYRFIYKEYGEYGNSLAEKTLNELGRQLTDELKYELPVADYKNHTDDDFDGSLSPLIKLATLLDRVCPEKKFVILLDEFDEINHELYRIGALAETFFSNLRALSGRLNIGFILIGSEGMPHVMNAQGHKLNKFSEESLESFDKNSEWNDYEELIKKPTNNIIKWHDSAINEIYNWTCGHPFFTKTICSKILEKSIRYKDAEVTGEDVNLFLSDIILSLDVNTFAHFWKDGIDGDYSEKEIQSFNRCRVLVGYARAKRKGEVINIKSIYNNAISGRKLSEDEVGIILRNFCLRKVMYTGEDGTYFIKLKLFEKWLMEKGINIIIADQLGDELAAAKEKKENDSRVNPEEISELVQKWPLYNGCQITSEDVRIWLNQESSQVNQRLLFSLLRNLRFPNYPEIHRMFKDAHDSLQRSFPVFIQRKKSDRRKDILITYLDGAGKSGSHYAPIYARENLLSVTSIVEFNEIGKVLKREASKDESNRDFSGMIIIDDFIGTGNTILNSIGLFIENNMEYLAKSGIPVKIVTLFATPEGEENIRNGLKDLIYSNIDLHVCEILNKKHFSFSENSNIWLNDEEKYQAKQICQNYGAKLVKSSAALGYKDQGLLLVLPRNCPNNTLPIFHTSKVTENFKWKALFERMNSI
jgi:hypothetical protein